MHGELQKGGQQNESGKWGVKGCQELYQDKERGRPEDQGQGYRGSS